uniref:Uncharacterized protein n=1 Tax=Aegilops tauschii subsp. strangulata TaxID=200361 RepID=A0A452XBH0_AEGTS
MLGQLTFVADIKFDFFCCVVHAGAAWSGAGEGDTRGVATQQDGPRRQEGAAGRKGHAAAKSLVQLSSFLAGLVALSCSFVGSCRKIM